MWTATATLTTMLISVLMDQREADVMTAMSVFQLTATATCVPPTLAARVLPTLNVTQHIVIPTEAQTFVQPEPTDKPAILVQTARQPIATVMFVRAILETLAAQEAIVTRVFVASPMVTPAKAER